jgi:hypothetical protein
MARPASTTYTELTDAILWVNASPYGEMSAWFCRDTGKILYGGDPDSDAELPADIDDETRYLPLPDKRDLDLGSTLALQFAREEMPNQYADVRDIFHHRHAYARFRDLIEMRGKLSAWHAYEEHATEVALRQWCADNDLPLAD